MSLLVLIKAADGFLGKYVDQRNNGTSPAITGRMGFRRECYLPSSYQQRFLQRA